MASRIIRYFSSNQAGIFASEFLTGHPGAWVVAPSRAAADELLRSAAQDRAGLLGVDRFTPLQAAAEIAMPALAADGLAPLTRLAQEALAARVTHEALRLGELFYFDGVAKMPGFARALSSTIQDLRLAGIEPEELGDQERSAWDLRLLLDRYRRELRERGLADHALIFRRAAQLLGQGANTRLSSRPLLWLDVPLRSAAQLNFAEALFARASEVCAMVLAPDATTATELERILGILATDTEPAAESQLDVVRRQLFVSHPEQSREADGSLETFSSPGEDLEAVELARRILKLSADGTRFDEVAILLRNPERYQPLVEAALRRAGIPGYFSHGTSRPDPAGRAFLALLACAQEKLSASRFAEYVSLGQVPPADETGAPQVMTATAGAATDELLSRSWIEPPPEVEEIEDTTTEVVAEATLRAPARWEQLLIDAAVIDGADRWRKRLDGLTQELARQAERLAEDEPHLERIQKQRRQLEHLKSFALPLIDALAVLPAQATWGEWMKVLDALARRSLRYPETVLAVLAELEPMAEVGPVQLDEVATVLSDRLRFLRREPPKRRYGAVFVGTVEEARAREFRVVFLPGLAEGLFPRRQFEDPLLLDDARERIGARLPRRTDRLAEERLLLRVAAASAGKKLIASYPRMDLAEARPRVPSFYALELPRAGEGRLPSLKSFEKEASERAPARLEWPAPPAAREAIDDVEYDLSSWRAVLGSAEKKGKLRYIVESNEHVARSLRTRWSRWNRNNWNSNDGLMSREPQDLASLEQYRLTGRAYSASSLQRFAACPYQFYLHAIARIQPREDRVAIEQMDPLTRGSLFHEVQFELFREMKQRGLTLSTWKLNEILELLDRVLDRVAARWFDELAPAIPRVWQNEITDIRTDLRGWLHEAVLDGDWEPVAAELAFGLAGENHERDAASRAEPVRLANGALLKGSIDLVERHRSRGTLRVTDHKTGRVPGDKPSYTGGGQFLQPLFYGWAAEEMLGAPVESARLFYATQRGNFDRVPVVINESARRFGFRLLEIVDEAISSGELVAYPREKACELCDYRPVCGPYEETRVRTKDGGEIVERVAEIRRMP